MTFLQEIGTIARERGGILNEVVQAKDRTPYLKIEKLFAEMQDAWKTNDIVAADKLSRINFRKIGDILESTFNFKDVMFVNTGTACTMSPRFSIDPFDVARQREIVKTPYGIAFKHKTYRALIFIGRYIVQDFTPAEATAILLHEIGHSFSEAADKYLWYMPPLFIAGVYVELLKMLMSTVKHNKDDTFAVLSAIYKTYEYVEMKIWDALTPLLPVTSPIFAYMKGIMNFDKYTEKSQARIISFFMLTIPKNILGHRSELSADYFAASCGYGAELGSALGKLGKTKDDYIESSSIMAAWVGLMGLQRDMLVEINQPHMITLDRMKVIRGYMQTAYDEASDPKMRAYLRDQIAELDDLIAAKAKVDDKNWSMVLARKIRGKDASDKDIQDLRYVMLKYNEEFGNLA